MKKLNLAMVAMREINDTPSGPIFGNIELIEDSKEVRFTAEGSVSCALENAVDLCRLFNLALVPRIEHAQIIYYLMG